MVQEKDTTAGDSKFEDNINKLKAYLRIRPFNGKEARLIYPTADQTGVTLAQEDKSDIQFSCDHVFNEESSQQDVFEKITPDLFQSFVDGENVCIFAYGQTGSGKTHSILGSTEDPGLLPRFINMVLKHTKEDLAKKDALIDVSFFEIYKEKVYDLLSQSGTPLRIRGGEKVYLEELKQCSIGSRKDFSHVLKYGLAKRSTAATLINEKSSRSHAIFQITLRKNQIKTINNVTKSYVIVSDCYFVDLAGSERITSFNNSVDRAETAAINCSLLALQKVIESKANGASAFVNFRESVLTRILKECFGGNSKTALLATVSAQSNFRQFTFQTLRFAMKAGSLFQLPKQNVDPFFRAIEDMKVKNDQMKAELEKLRRELGNNNNNESVLEFNQISLPCLLELFSDPSLKSYLKVEQPIVNLGTVDNADPIVAITFENESNCSIKCLKKEVAVNGNILNVDEEISLQHNDKIALNGSRFFVYLSDSLKQTTMATYHEVKLQYVENTFPLLERRMRETARQEFANDQKEMLERLNEELLTTKNELSQLQSNHAETAKEKREIRRRKSELEQGLQETEEFRKNLLNVAVEKTQAFEHALKLNSEQKAELIRLKTNVASSKQLLATMLKQRNPFSIALNSTTMSFEEVIDVASIRLFDRKKKLFADLRISEFDSFYDKLVEYYQDSGFANNSETPYTTDVLRNIETIFLDGTWTWKNYGTANRSNIFNSTMHTIMRDTATARRSTVGELKKSLSARKSVIAEALALDIIDDNSAWTAFAAQLNLLHLNSQDNFIETTSVIQFIFRSLYDIREKMLSAKLYNKREVLSEGNLSQAIFIVHDFTRSVDSLRDTLYSYSKDKNNEYSYLFVELYTVANSIYKEKNRWISAIIDNLSVEKFEKTVEDYIDTMHELIGRLSFYLRENFPDNKMFEAARPRFQKGVMNSIENSCKDVKQLYREYKNCTNSRGIIITPLCRCIASVYNSIAELYNPLLAFGILPQLLDCKLKICEEDIKWNELYKNLTQLFLEIRKLDGIDMVVSCKLQSDLNICRRAVDSVISKTTTTTDL